MDWSLIALAGFLLGLAVAGSIAAVVLRYEMQVALRRALRRADRCTGCWIDWFQFHHDIRSDCPVHDVAVKAREGGMIRLDGERWHEH